MAPVKCDRCGRDNPPSLRFCQDCGNRLQAASARAVEPTPPRGVPLADVPRQARRTRISILHRAVRRAESDAHCGRRGAANPAGSRFCAECGGGAGGVPAPAEPRSDPAPAGRPSAALHAAPVVGLAAGALVEQPPVVCSRCRGTNAPQMAYCQYCGGRLQDGPPLREAPEPAPPAPPAHQPAVAPAAPAPADRAPRASARPGPPGEADRRGAGRQPRPRVPAVAPDH